MVRREFLPNEPMIDTNVSDERARTKHLNGKLLLARLR